MKIIILVVLVTLSSFGKTLIMIGGGERPSGALKHLVKLTDRNKKIVVLPWGTSFPIESFKAIEKELDLNGSEYQQVVCLCYKDLSKKDIATLKRAGAIYFPGGNQNKIMAKVQKYRLRSLFKELYENDIPIAGTSAGTAIQTEYMLTGNGSDTARGLGFLKGFIVDQHFHKREREPRLLKALKNHPGHFGLGVDEDMSLVITDKIEFIGIGPSIVSIYIPKRGNGYKRIDLNNYQTYIHP